MKQPELGLKVTELRQQKGLTQEQLAEHCEVSARTIQRIEGGEVDPRLFTLNNLSEVLDFDFFASDLENEMFWLALLHLSSVICFVPIPLLLWSWQKSKSYQVDQHGRAVLNFQVTMTLGLLSGLGFLVIVVPLVLMFFQANGFAVGLMGWGVMELAIILVILFGLFAFIQGVLNTGRVLNDKPYHYPLSIKFLK